MALSEKQVLFCLKPSRIYSTFLLRLGTAPTITMSFIHVPQPPHDFWVSCLNWTIMLNCHGHYYSSIFLTASSYLVMDTAARIRSEIIALVLPSSWIFNGSPLLTWKLNLWSKNTVLKMMIKSLLKLMKKLSQSYLWWEAMKIPFWWIRIYFTQIKYWKNF